MREININSIHGGVSQTLNQGESNSYIGACAINPDAKIGERISGSISPTSYQKFNDLKDVLWFEPNDVNSNIYFYTKDGKFGYISNTNVVTVISTLTNASGNGLKYYNNYYYIATNNDIHRYGPMNGTPTLEENWWTGSKIKENVFAIDIDNYDGNMFTDIIAEGWHYAVAQGVQETSDITFRYVEFPIKKVSQYDSDFEISISLRENTIDDKPSDTKIAEEIISSAEITGPPYSNSSDNLGHYTSVIADLGEQTLSANTRYWFVIERVGTWVGDNGDVLAIPEPEESVYSNGERLVKTSSSSGWLYTSPSKDMLLALYKDKETVGQLGNETYPTVGNYTIPNHSMFLHSDNALYVTDYKGNKGSISKIMTGPSIGVYGIQNLVVGDFIVGESSGSTATILSIQKEVSSVLGQTITNGTLVLTNTVGEFEVGETVKNIGEETVVVSSKLGIGKTILIQDEGLLGLSYGEKPIAISNYGYDLGIITYKGNEARMLLWDTLAYAPYRSIGLPYNLASAIHTHNGDLFVFGGKDRMTIGRYIGGETIEEVFHCDHSLLPLQGAVKSNSGRILIGTKQTYPEERGCIWSYGTIATMPDRLHPIISNPTQITAISDDYSSSDGLYKEATSGYNSIFRSQVYNFSQPFTITAINFSLTDDNDTEITAKLHYDNDRIIETHTVTLEDDSRNFTIYPEHNGTTNFYLELLIEGDDFVSINLPIRIIVE